MTIPLVMMGPGGDYTTTLNVRGRGLTRQTGSVNGTLSGQGHDPQGDSAGGYAQWGCWRKQQASDQAETATIEQQQAPNRPQADRFDHIPAQTPTDVYTSRGTLRANPGRSVVIASALNWLAKQQRILLALGRLTGSFRLAVTATDAPIRLPGPPAKPPYPTLNLPIHPSAITQPSKLPGTEANHEHESHPQTATYSHPHPRHPLGARLFADDAGAGRRTQRLQGHRLRARRGADQKGRADQKAQQGALFGG